MERYRPLGDYALIGDARTAALVARGGSLDWWCLPRFDGGSVFARILDHDRGGVFAIAPTESAQPRIAYEEGTNVVRHRFEGVGGAATLTDALAWPPPPGAPGSVLLRVVEGERGAMEFDVQFAPRPEYAQVPRNLKPVAGGVAVSWPHASLTLLADARLEVDRDEAIGSFEVHAGERVAFVATSAPTGEGRAVPTRDATTLLDATRAAWRAWDARTRRDLPASEAVRRSALALRMLIYEPTGAVIAAPTTSLPEAIGGVRNWDYRYSWVRDGAFFVHALRAVGHPAYAQNFLSWLVSTAKRGGPPLRVLYAVDGASETPERELPQFEGYRRSAPVRVGNAAFAQSQLDIHGELLASVHVGAMLGIVPDGEATKELAAIADHVAATWHEPDSGIWEARAAPRHYVVSKAMAWVALDRALLLGLPGDRDWWRRERDAVRRETLARGWNEELGAFQMAFDYPVLDAATLLLPLVGFVDARDPRMRATVARIERDLLDGALVHRYLGADDGVAGGEGAFTYCTFWLVDNLALQGRLEEASTLLARVIAHATPLGLFSEEVDARTGELLGNFPQALPHLGVLHSAVLLGELGVARKPRAASPRGAPA
ncbi:MAG: glycoside hydrolase family 15 protein [Thermoplasmatota archaeon]